MKNTKEPILLIHKIEKQTIYDAPAPLALMAVESEKVNPGPFPLSRQQQYELLYLIRTRKSGIITREELQNIIFVKHTLH